jgi:uncharacterized membrane protein
MPKKFDTNPLDPEFPARAKAQSENMEAETRSFADPLPTDGATRRFNDAQFGGFGEAPVYAPAAPSNTERLATMNESSTRKVEKIGLPENMLVAMPYVPFSIGLIVGILELLFVPRSENKVRFHAAQGLAVHIGIWIITAIMGAVGSVTNFANFGSGIFTLVTTIMLVVWAIKAWRGKPVHIEAVDNLSDWLEEKLKPLSKQ